MTVVLLPSDAPIVRTRPPPAPPRPARRIRPRTRHRPTWPQPIQALRSQHLTAPPTQARRQPRMPSRALRLMRAALMIRVRTIPVTARSRSNTPTSRRRPCPTTTSLRLPATAICGRPATGPGVKAAIIGFPADGWRLPTRARCGRPATGATTITAMGFTVATGVRISASMAAWTTALAMSASATRAATGAADTSITTARSTM